jgi:hypothetical protein
MASFSRTPDGKSGFYINYEEYVRYDNLPF